MPHQPRNFTLELYHDQGQGRRMVKVHAGTFEENRDTLSPEMIETRPLVLTHNLQTPQGPAKKFAKEKGAGCWHY